MAELSFVLTGYLGGNDLVLTLGMGARYVEAADQVEVLVYLKGDDDLFHPELIDSATGKLYYKKNHQLGQQVSFDKFNGTATGEIKLFFIHPSQITDLSCRLDLTIGATPYTLTQDVWFDAAAPLPIMQNIQPALDNPNASSPGFVPDASEALSKVDEIQPWETNIGVDKSDPELLVLDLTKDMGYLVKGTGPIDYAGGGGRFLTRLDNKGFVYQALDELYPELSGKAIIEGASTNITPNPGFQLLTSGFPQGYAYSWEILNQVNHTANLAPYEEITLETLVDSVQQLKLRLHGAGPFEGPRTFKFVATNYISVNTAQPLTVSLLARTIVNMSSTITKTLKLYVTFYNNLNAVLGTRESNYDSDQLTSGFGLLEVDTTVSQYPAGTTKVKWGLDIASFEASDDLTTIVALPQVEQYPLASSRMLTTRAIDDLTTPQLDQWQISEGSVEVRFAPNYSGVPKTRATFFDTRNGSGLNGFVAYHDTTGQIGFDIYNSTGIAASTVTTGSVSLSFGVSVTLFFTWAAQLIRILKGTDLLKDRSGTWVQPTALNLNIQIGADYAKTHPLNGELQFFEVRRVQPD